MGWVGVSLSAPRGTEGDETPLCMDCSQSKYSWSSCDFLGAQLTLKEGLEAEGWLVTAVPGGLCCPYRIMVITADTFCDGHCSKHFAWMNESVLNHHPQMRTLRHGEA